MWRFFDCAVTATKLKGGVVCAFPVTNIVGVGYKSMGGELVASPFR
jgi:hypothetical protein